MKSATATDPPDAESPAKTEIHRTIQNHVDRLIRYIRKNFRLGDDEINEVLADLTVEALKSAEKFQGDRSALAWLMGFVIRVVQHRKRKKSRDRLKPDQASIDVIAVLTAEDRGEDVRLAVARLPEPFRSAIEARYFEDLDGQALADRLEVSRVLSRKRVERGLQMLRKDRGIGREGNP